jgi:hypothetical protein
VGPRVRGGDQGHRLKNFASCPAHYFSRLPTRDADTFQDRFPKHVLSRTTGLLLHEPYCMIRTGNREFVTSFSHASLSHRVIHFTAAAWRSIFDVLDVVDDFDVIQYTLYDINLQRHSDTIARYQPGFEGRLIGISKT